MNFRSSMTNSAANFGIAALAFISMGSSPALAAAPPPSAHIQALVRGDADLNQFYATRSYRPLWTAGGRVRPEAQLLLNTLRAARLDGLDPPTYLRSGVEQAVQNAATERPALVARAEVLLSASFAAFVRDVRRDRAAGVIYGEEALRPRPLSHTQVLLAAAAAPSLQDYLRNLGWMHPIYGQLRRELERVTSASVRDHEREQLLQLNMNRASILPAGGRYVMVDTTGARLHYVDNGRVKMSMRVVVGTAKSATPMMAGMIRWATLNPYWHIPTDMARDRIAPRVLADGMSYLTQGGYEVVSEWSHTAKVIDPRTVDWKAVANGKADVFVRQKPGPQNGMGKVKFQFPNEMGIYLHDTPAKQLFTEDTRNYSAGCVRLEDADALGAMLFGSGLPPQSRQPEQTVPLPSPVPVYLTYLTLAPDESGRIVERRDIYGRDKTMLAKTSKSVIAGGGFQ